MTACVIRATRLDTNSRVAGSVDRIGGCPMQRAVYCRCSEFSSGPRLSLSESLVEIVAKDHGVVVLGIVRAVEQGDVAGTRGSQDGAHASGCSSSSLR